MISPQKRSAHPTFLGWPGRGLGGSGNKERLVRRKHLESEAQVPFIAIVIE